MPFERIINPSDFPLPKINENVILFFNLNLFFMFRDFCSPTKVKSFGPSKKYNFQHQEKAYTAIGGCIGAPLAAITLENAIESGGKHFLTFGTAGWLSATESPPDLINHISTAHDQTGISRDYGSPTEIIETLQKSNTTKSYQVVSTNSFYQLTKNKIEKYQEQGITLIDMEIAPLLFIASLYKLKLNPVFVISDYVDHHYQWFNIAKSESFIDGTKTGLKELLDLDF